MLRNFYYFFHVCCVNLHGKEGSCVTICIKQSVWWIHQTLSNNFRLPLRCIVCVNQPNAAASKLGSQEHEVPQGSDAQSGTIYLGIIFFCCLCFGDNSVADVAGPLGTVGKRRKTEIGASAPLALSWTLHQCRTEIPISQAA